MSQARLAEQERRREQHTKLFVEGCGWSEPANGTTNSSVRRPDEAADPAAMRRLSTSRPTFIADVPEQTGNN